jgi:hypothetical protein
MSKRVVQYTLEVIQWDIEKQHTTIKAETKMKFAGDTPVPLTQDGQLQIVIATPRSKVHRGKDVSFHVKYRPTWQLRSDIESPRLNSDAIWALNRWVSIIFTTEVLTSLLRAPLCWLACSVLRTKNSSIRSSESRLWLNTRLANMNEHMTKVGQSPEQI